MPTLEPKRVEAMPTITSAMVSGVPVMPPMVGWATGFCGVFICVGSMSTDLDRLILAHSPTFRDGEIETRSHRHTMWPKRDGETFVS